MLGLRRTYTKATTLSKLWTRRNFTTTMSLFRPIATDLEITAHNMKNELHLTYDMIAENDRRIEEYNKQANTEYDEMVAIRIKRICDSGLLNNWRVEGEDDYLKASFEFPTSDHAHHFTNQISKYCSVVDHHPEWNMINDKCIEVSLTSHFNENKVSLKDYELADHMNKVAAKSRAYNQYRYLTAKKQVTLFITLVGLFFVSFGIHQTYEELEITSRDVPKCKVKTDCSEPIQKHDLHQIALEYVTR